MCRDDYCTLRVKLQHIWKMLYRTIYIPSFSWLMRNSLNCFMLVCCMSLDNLKQRLVEWWSLTRYYCSLWRQTQPQDTSDQLRDSLFVQTIPDDSHWLSVIIHFHRDFIGISAGSAMHSHGMTALRPGTWPGPMRGGARHHIRTGSCGQLPGQVAMVG